MSSPASIPPAALIQFYQDARSGNNCGMAVTAMFLYDYILCLGREYQYIWQSRKSKASWILYLFIRYTFLFVIIVSLPGIQPVSDTSCAGLAWTIIVSTTLSFLGPAAVTTLRTYVLSGQNKLLGAVTLILSFAPFIVNATTAYQVRPINLPAPQNCVQAETTSAAVSLGLVVCSRSCAILADLIAIVVTWRATRNSRRVLRNNFQQSSLEHVMWTNGNIYFFTLLSINVLDLILVALSITADNSDESYVIVFLDPINAILNCHFLLDLYEANAQIERGGPSLSHSNPTLSLHFTGSPQDSADAPEHSTFLSSFAGPVYTFHAANTDPDLADSEPEAASGVSAQIATEDVGKEA